MSESADPFRISSNTLSKLNAFRYAQNENESSSQEQSTPQAAFEAVNVDRDDHISRVFRGVETTPSQSKFKPSIQSAESKPIRDCPRTPANKIPLEDLISNTEDAFRLAPIKEVTPEDYVTWKYAPGSSDPSNMTPATWGKKRRHSSSPISSPLVCHSKESKEPFDMQTFQSLLTTPQNDLAADLWNNYVGKSKVDCEGETLPPRFTNLFSSSPRTPSSTRRDTSGLRRSVSCNVDWPTSKAKRRKLCASGESMNRKNNLSHSRSDVLEPEGLRSSKISFLVEKIKGSLAKTSKAPMGIPPSSSPLTEGLDVDEGESPSPIKGGKPPQAFSTRCEGVTEAAVAESPQQTNFPHEVNVPESSSEFEDEDLDQELLEFVGSTIDSFAPQSRALRVEESRVSEDPFSTQSPYPTEELMNLGVCGTNTRICSDEFDDDDDEFPENINDMLVQYDKSVPSKRERFSGGIQSSASTSFSCSPSRSIGQSDKRTKKVRFSDTIQINPDTSSSRTFSRTLVKGVEQMKAIKKIQTTLLEDEFGDDDDDDFDLASIENSMIHSSTGNGNQNHKSRQAIKRYLIVNVEAGTYITPKGRPQPEQVLLVQDQKTDHKKAIILRESWFDSPCGKHDYLHLIGDFDAQGQCIVDNSENMIILHPDHLISATVVADSISCQRRAVLQDRIKATVDASKPQVFGHILHEVFQEAMKRNRWNLSWLRTTVETIVTRFVESLYAIHMSISEAVEYVMSKIPELRVWANIFLRAKPNPESLVEDRHGSKASLSINKLLEVEEHIWSPMYGLKGNVDATVQVVYRDGTDDKILTVPLEVKTGRKETNHSHRAQTALYTLLLSDRYDIEVSFGLLYYLEMTKTFRIQGIRHEILQIIQERNRLAGYVREKLALPPMLKRPHMCNQCYSKTACFIYHKLVDDGDGETSGIGNRFLDAVGHLNNEHRDFFKKWDDLLTKEERNMMKFRRELWTMLSDERETLGRCFGKVVIEPGSEFEDQDGPKINRYRYIFVKQKATTGFSFVESQITIGEPIVISDEDGHFALANGYVLHINPKRITVAVDRKLHGSRTRMPGFDPVRNQSFRGLMEISEEGGLNPEAALPESEQTLYRLDKDEFSNGMATVRNNLVCMMEKDLLHVQQLRKLIIEGQAPSFKQASAVCELPNITKANLNADQKQVIEKVMGARDYALVLGMPGTGKTTTISHIIRVLVAQGKSVLLTSYTHTAVDNILLKIRDDNIRILRLGATAKIHPEVQKFADLASVPKKTIEELQVSYEQSKVVATTCLGINHPIFNERVFDYCIVDEASQITLPVCLGPIRMARTFILVGDHYQLPPLVQNKEAQEGGLDVSLFKLLSDTQPSSVVSLEHQYRMCEEIMLLSNTLVYSGRLKCGTPEVASRCLKVPNISGLKQHHKDPLLQPSSQQPLCLGSSQARCWLRDLLDPSVKTLLVNTDTLVPQALDSTNGSRVVNTTEVTLCTQLIQAFVSSGISARDIGVITFYRSQLSLLKQNLRRYSPELEMHTTDRFQGRDKEIVILSCVRSNSDNNVGDLLRDWRRLNVALTRARTKLLVIGSKSTLRGGTELLDKYVNLMEEQGWIYDLPKSAVEDHFFEDDDIGLSQTHAHRTPTPSPKKSPIKKEIHHPLGGIKHPEKRGARLLNGDKIAAKRPVLRDVINEVLG
ncbi:DNA replication factor Dna2 domain containing protein [Elaphomyces granulatus]